MRRKDKLWETKLKTSLSGWQISENTTIHRFIFYRKDQEKIKICRLDTLSFRKTITQ